MNTLQKLLLLPAMAAALTLNLHAGGTNDAATFTGTVVDAQGQPVAGAKVVLYQYPPRMGIGVGGTDLEVKQQATTDGQGAFALPTFRGTGILLATNAGFAPGWQTLNNSPQEPPKIVLGKSSALAGMVVDDLGQPVAGAEVWVSSAINGSMTASGQPSYVFGQASRELFSTQTGADGNFRIGNFPEGAQANLAVKKPGMALRQPAGLLQYNQLPFHAGQEDITLTLALAGSVSGKIVVRATGQPLASALVGLQPVVPGVVYSTINAGAAASAANGSFQLSDVPAGSYQVMAVFTNAPIPDWVADPVRITVASGQSVSNVQLEAYKGGVAEVTVRGKDNEEPLADASVSMNNGDYNRGGSTGTNGIAYFRLPPGRYTAFANKLNWSQAQAQTTVTEGQTTVLTLELGAPFKISGFVRDASGAPVAGALVGVFPNYGGNENDTRSDTDGHYALAWLKPNWGGMSEQTFYLVARDSERNLAAIHEIDETTTNLNVTLKPAMSVSGSVKDTRGNAVTNATAYVMLHRERSGFTISRRPLHPDGHGRIREDALPRGERYGIYVSARGYGNGQEEMQAAEPNADHHEFPPLVLKIADRQLAGRVLGTDGKPVAGVQVWMNGQGQPNGTAMTDANGRFAFNAVCDGAVSVSANFKGLYGSAEAVGGATNVVIRFNANNRAYMASAQTLTGAVFDPAGNPAAGVRVVVTPSFGAADEARTDAKGEYSVNWQAQPGMRGAKYYVVARNPAKNLAAIEPIETNQKRMTLRLGPGLAISGTVQDEKGVPLPRANINLNLMAGNMGGMVEYERVKLNSDGTFTIPALPMGQRYLVSASANGYGSENRNVGTAESRTNRIRLQPFRLQVADRQLAGQVLDAGGKPLPGAQVNINGRGQPNGYTRTDTTGHFQFKVCSGLVQIYAWAPSASGRNNFGSVYALGGDTKVVVKIGERQGHPKVVRGTGFKPEPWTLSALAAWPGEHKSGAIILLSLQAVVLLGTGGGVFWLTRKRGKR